MLFENSELKAEGISQKDCMQPQLKQPSKLHPDYQRFVYDYETKGFLYVAKKYGDLGWRYKKKCLIKSLKRIVKLLEIK